MMELKGQVCNLELSKKLGKLKVKQNSVWYWNHYRSYAPEFKPKWAIKNHLETDIKHTILETGCSAFTVAELGDMLGWGYRSGKTGVDTYICNDNFSNIKIEDKTEANARAKMLIYLIEEKLSRKNQCK